MYHMTSSTPKGGASYRRRAPMSAVSQERRKGWRGSRTSAMIATVGRALLAAIFVFAGVSKVVGPQPYLDHLKAFGVPAILLPAVIVLEIGAGVTLLAGWRQGIAGGALGIC